MSGPQPIDLTGLGLAAFLLLVHAAVSLRFQLGLERRLAWAALRATAQLFLLGYLLERVFHLDEPLLVIGVMLLMTLLAGREALARTTRRVPGLSRVTGTVMLVSAWLVTLHGLILVLGVEPWWSPRHAIPILGMILGNTLTGISLGLEALLRALDEQRASIEGHLAMGASPQRATREWVQEAIRTATVPILNTMAVVGVVSIPGMMTGQILGGGDAALAARYQLFILFAIAAGTAGGAVGAVLWARSLLFDERCRLRLDRLERRRA